MILLLFANSPVVFKSNCHGQRLLGRGHMLEIVVQYKLKAFIRQKAFV